MSTQFTAGSFLALLSVVTGLIVTIILLSFSKPREISNKILAIYMLCLTWVLFIAFLNDSGLIIKIPHLYRTGHFVAFILIFINVF